MIITWFTTPSARSIPEESRRFSSYYQCDTVSKKFVRIRLALGRSDQGGTFVGYKEKRYVGFGDGSQKRKQLERWSINDKDELCYDNAPLETSPKAGLRTFDTSDKDKFIHRGSVVVKEANFPEDIAPKHLSLLANEAIITGEDFDLTNSAAKPEDLSKALKDKVCEILGKEDFSEITDEDILKKLKSQVKAIKEKSIEPNKESLDKSLDEVDGLIKEIEEAMKDFATAPNQDFTKSFEAFQKSVKSAQDASKSGKGIKAAIEKLKDNKINLKIEAQKLLGDESSKVERVIDQYNKAIETAQKESETWESIETEYNTAEEAESIKDYEESIGMEELE